MKRRRQPDDVLQAIAYVSLAAAFLFGVAVIFAQLGRWWIS